MKTMPPTHLTQEQKGVAYTQQTRQASALRGKLKFGGFLLLKKFRNLKYNLTNYLNWVLCLQQTRQASVLRDTLNSGGFLFFGVTGGAL